MTKLSELEKSIQAILFASGEPYEKDRLAKILEIDRDTLEKIIERINELYKKTAFVILELDQSYQMVTRAEYAQVIQKALEVKNNTVDSGSVVNSLVAKGLVEEQGRLEIPGRPISYGTTEHFLRCFGMKNIEALPKLPQQTQMQQEEPTEQ